MNLITIPNQKAFTIQLREVPAHLPRPRATASPIRIRLIIPTPTSMAEVHRLSPQAIQDMEVRAPGQIVRGMAITSRPNLHINPETTTIGLGTTLTGGIHIMENTQTARGM